jgi:hypothetical protein
MSARKFSGNIRIAQVNTDGVYTGGFIGILNTTKLELQIPKPDAVQQISNQNGTLGQLISQGLIPKPTSADVTFDDTNDQRVLGMAFNGSTQTYTQSGGTIAAATYAAPAVLGDWLKLAHRGVSAVVVTDSTAATTYAAGTDYVVDAAPGFIRILPGGAITAAESLKINYTAAALSGQTILGGAVAFNMLRIEGHMQDIMSGGTAYVVIPLYQAQASGNTDFFGKDLLVAALSGGLLLPPVGTAANTETGGKPFRIDELS